MRKKRIFICLSAIICLAMILCSCSKSPSGSEIPSTKATNPSSVIDETTTSAEISIPGVYNGIASNYEEYLIALEAYNLEINMTLNEDGTGILTSGDDSTDINWSKEGDQLVLEIEGGTYSSPLENGIIRLDLNDENYLLLAKDDADLSKYDILSLDEVYDIIGEPSEFTTTIPVRPENEYLEQENDYCINYFGFSMLTEEQINAGYYYVCSHGTEDGVPTEAWPVESDMFTACYLGLSISTYKDMSESFTDRFRGVVVFNEPSDFDRLNPFDEEYQAEVIKNNPTTAFYKMTPIFSNPGQLTDEETQAYSYDGKLLKDGEEGELLGMFNISEEAYATILNGETAIPITIYFTLGDGVLYTADLHEFFEYFCSDF